MRPVAAAILAVAGALLGSGLVACFDLLHSTSDLETACAIDASAAGCSHGESAGAICAPSRADAWRSADHACAWLGACETPMGRNALGTCLFAARLAFDCEANPSHPVRSTQAALWSCLAAARSCDDVDRCVFPTGPQQCSQPADYTSCGTAGTSAGPNDFAVRLECTDGGTLPYPNAHGESCALWGQTCSLTEEGGSCAPLAAPGCAADECSGPTGSILSWCAAGVNVGIDCAASGKGTCTGLPAEDAAAWLACVPVSDAGATCTPDYDAGCSAGWAQSCAAGVPESLDCAALLGASPDAESCQAGPLDPPFDWTSPCTVQPPECAADTCDGGMATGCARGATFSVDCSEAGLGPCAMRATDQATQLHAACTPLSR